MDKQQLVQRLMDEDDMVCPLCRERAVTSLHHIIPRSRTSKRRPAWWLWDERNLLMVCAHCDTAMLHTVKGIRRCIAAQLEKHSDWDYSTRPWSPYLHFSAE